MFLREPATLALDAAAWRQAAERGARVRLVDGEELAWELSESTCFARKMEACEERMGARRRLGESRLPLGVDERT